MLLRTWEHGTITFRRKTKVSKKRLIFGLGTGRCGTASLAYLMSHQDSTHASHELFPILPWEVNTSTLTHKWTTMDHQSHLFDAVFDSGSYFLPYVQVLINSWKMHDYAKNRYELRFICLKRDREETVKSYLKKFQNQNNNPLQNHGDSNLIKNEWDSCYPKYNNCTLEEALEKFHEEYYSFASLLEKQNPEIFKIFETNSLNEDSEVERILSFAGYESPKIITKIQKRKH